MPEPLIFDCNASYGPFHGKHLKARWTLEHLIEDLDLAGIAGALVHHQLALSDEALTANRRLVRELRPHRARLFPCWVVHPNVAGEMPSPADLVREMRDHDVRAVHFTLDRHPVPLHPGFWHPLRDALIDAGIPALVSGGHDARFATLDSFLSLMQGLPIIMTGHRWSHWLQVMALMHAHPHLHLEFSAFQANRAVEFVAQHFGIQRCLVGTNLPHMAPGAARGFVDYSLLSQDDVNHFAHGNLKRLLQGACPASVPKPTPWRDSITTAVRAGQPLPCFVFDAHCHIGHDGCVMLSANIAGHRGDAAGMIELKDRVGIDKTAIMSWAGPANLDTDRGNEVVAEAVRRYPDRFVGLPTVNPAFDDVVDIERIILHYHQTLGFPGLKTFTAPQSIEYDHPAFARWLRFANEHHLYFVLDPAGRHDTDMVRRLATSYPNVSFHLDHCGQSWAYADWACEVVQAFPNLYAQLNFTNVTNGVIEHIVEMVGADRVLFGTDSPMRDPRPQATWLAFTRLPEVEKSLIYGANFLRDLRRGKLKPV